MSQPKNRRRAARRLQQKQKRESFYIHFTMSGKTRNPVGARAPLDMLICIGFGSATVERDGVVVVDGEHSQSGKERRLFCNRQGFVQLRKVEKYIARRRLGRSTWRVCIDAPLWSAKWERRGPDRWLCTEAGEGFA